MIAPTSPTPTAAPGTQPAGSLLRRFMRGTAFWLFGLSVSVLIGTLWGSTAAGNRGTIDRVVDQVAQSETVQRRLMDWAVRGLDLARYNLRDRTGTVERLMHLPAMEQVLEELTAQAVDAAFAPVGLVVWIDPAAILLPATPDITVLLRSEGIDVDEQTVGGVISSVDPIPLSSDDGFQFSASATRVSRTLTLAALAAGLAAVLFGVTAVLISPDRRAAVRHLGFRLTLTGLSFAMLLRLGAWIADPQGGGSPWRVGIARLLASHLDVPLVVAGIGAAVACLGALRWSRRRLRSRSAADPVEEPETPSTERQEPGFTPVIPASGVGDVRERAAVQATAD